MNTAVSESKSVIIWANLRSFMFFISGFILAKSTVKILTIPLSKVSIVLIIRAIARIIAKTIIILGIVNIKLKNATEGTLALFYSISKKGKFDFRILKMVKEFE